MNVDEYIAGFDGPVQRRLQRIRDIILRCAPESVESIAYAMPAYKLCGTPLVYFAGYPKHIGLYATPSGHAAFTKELAAYKQGKGSVQFPHDAPLPIDLIEKMVMYRVNDIGNGPTPRAARPR